MQLAIAEEYGARALYEGVLQDFPEASLFARIARSETQHALSLTRLADKYGVTYPTYPGPADINFDSIEAACAAGVEAEIVDAALYDELKAYTTHTDLLQVYTAPICCKCTPHCKAPRLTAICPHLKPATTNFCSHTKKEF